MSASGHLRSPSGPSGVPTVLPLEGAQVSADWGSTTLIADLLGRAPSGRPEAEVWFGAHARHPSLVDWQGELRPLTEVAGTLGIATPTFLVKLLAAGAPLSIQVHPDTPTARSGYAAEDAAGVPVDAAERRFADPSAKPELLRAITPMRILCGLRPAMASRQLLAALVPTGADPLLAALAGGDAALGELVDRLLRMDPRTTGAMLDAVVAGAHALISSGHREAGDTAPQGPPPTAEALRLAELALDLIDRFPGDAGVLVALLLEDLDLLPGEAVFVAPGTPHAYLAGLGLEVMASSDNVLRGGMTSKHVDVDAFLRVLDPSAVGALRVGTLTPRMDGTGWRRFLTPTDAFLLEEAEIDGALRVERTGDGPAVLVCLFGQMTVRAGDGSAAELRPGGAVLLTAGLDPVEVRGRGQVLHVRAARRIAAADDAPVRSGSLRGGSA
jgi:mannose-6-phosphate isomerase